MPHLVVNAERLTDLEGKGFNRDTAVSTFANEILLRILVGEEDRYGDQQLYKAIVERALAMRLAGATVLSCFEGIGPSHHVRSGLNVDAGPRLPMAIEIIDTEVKIKDFLSQINDMVDSGLVTLERVQAIRYRQPAQQEIGPSAERT